VHAHNVGVTLLHQVGLDNLVVKTEDDYVEKAVELASNVPSLASLRLGLREKMLKSYLCDGPNFVKGIEENYRRLWHRYCDGGISLETNKDAENNEALITSRSTSTFGDVTDLPMKEAGSAALGPTTVTTPSPTSTLSTTEGNSLGETRSKCQKRSPSSPDQPSTLEVLGADE